MINLLGFFCVLERCYLRICRTKATTFTKKYKIVVVFKFTQFGTQINYLKTIQRLSSADYFMYVIINEQILKLYKNFYVFRVFPPPEARETHNLIFFNCANHPKQINPSHLQYVMKTSSLCLTLHMMNTSQTFLISHTEININYIISVSCNFSDLENVRYNAV